MGWLPLSVGWFRVFFLIEVVVNLFVVKQYVIKFAALFYAALFC